MNLTRRGFLKSTGAVAVIAGLPGMALASAPREIEPERYVALFFKESNSWYRIGVPTSTDIEAAVKGGAVLEEFLNPFMKVMLKASRLVMYDDNTPDEWSKSIDDLELANSSMEMLRKMPVTSLNRVIEAEGVVL